MDDALGWTLYVSISAAVTFFFAGYVARSAVLTRRVGTSRSISEHGESTSGQPRDPSDVRPERMCCEANVSARCAGSGNVVGAAPEPLDEADGPLATADDEETRDTPSKWPPEQPIGLPPLSCPPSSHGADAFPADIFPAEASTRPFHGTTSQQAAAGRHREHDEDIERLQREVRRLATEQHALDLRVEDLSQSIEPPRRRVQFGSGAPDALSEPVSESAFASVLDAMPPDVSFAVVADSLGLPLAHRGRAQTCIEIAASLGHVKQLAGALTDPAGLRSPVRRVQIDDHAGKRLECWLVETDDGPYGVMLVRRSGTPDADVEQRVAQIAAVLSADGVAYTTSARL